MARNIRKKLQRSSLSLETRRSKSIMVNSRSVVKIVV